MSEARSVQEVEFNAERHEFRRDGILYPSVTKILASAGRCPWDFVDEETRLHSMRRGSSVHWMTQLEDEGALNYRTVTARLRGYRRAWNSWKQRSGFVVVKVEYKFILPQYGFAGIVDRVGYFISPPGLAIVDLKTGAIQNHVRLQLAPYTLAVDQRPAMARNIRRIALRLNEDGTYFVREYPRATYDRDLATFMQDLEAMKRNA